MKSKFFLLPLLALALTGGAAAKTIELLNVSYDPTREFYEDYNKLFETHWKAKSGDNVHINQSHGGSGKQGRAILAGRRVEKPSLLQPW